MRTNPIALITGASNGIGLELAKLFARESHDLALVARSHDKLKYIAEDLQQTYGVQVKYYTKDLSISSTPEEIFEALQSEGGNIDVLVNNAGFGWRGEFAQMELTDTLEMIQVNITTLTHLTRLFLPGMIERRRGKILNVASTAAFQPGPMMAIYYASKAYVLSFSEALSEELQGTGVTVTAFCPGPTATGFGKRAGFTNEKIFGGMLSMDPYTVALDGYKGLMKGKPLIISGWKNWLGTQLVRIIPRPLPARLVKKVQQKRGA
ncbi:MAG: SDR family oxidoreductase [Bacteroidota bacterium]|jgi:short-subunit dehydrogenase